MATSSILGGSQLPEEISGKDMQALGPSDNSDSGSDAIGAYSDEALASDTDSFGTGERASIDPGADHTDVDIRPDHIERAADIDLDEQAGDDFDDLSAVEALADDSDDLEAEDDAGDDDAGASRKA
ncbi:MAG: hypothetical protein JWR68_2599 [Polaromonas sp.]|nr:hypothetical protein [Polaromonas sp.]